MEAIETFWYCNHCDVEVSGAAVTYEETHGLCGNPIGSRAIVDGEELSAQIEMTANFKAEIQRLRKELAKHEWQPIETAPMGSGSIGIFDRSLPDYEGAPDLLLVCDGEVKIGCYEWCHDPVVGMAAEKAASPWISEEGYAVHPTHWMQLPAPPKEDA